MSEAFLSALKWYILCFFIIVGTTAFKISSDTGSNKPVIIGVVAYGVVYIMSYFWTVFRGRILFYSVATFVTLTLGSPYVPDMMYILFGLDQVLFEETYTWLGTVAFVGLPVMTYVFYRYD